MVCFDEIYGFGSVDHLIWFVVECMEHGNVGLIFTKGDLKEVSEEVAKYKVCLLTKLMLLFFLSFGILQVCIDYLVSLMLYLAGVISLESESLHFLGLKWNHVFLLIMGIF